MTRLEPTLQKLAASQLEFLRAADSISAADWQQPPVTGGWSAAELVAHLCLGRARRSGLCRSGHQKDSADYAFLQALPLPASDRRVAPRPAQSAEPVEPGSGSRERGHDCRVTRCQGKDTGLPGRDKSARSRRILLAASVSRPVEFLRLVCIFGSTPVQAPQATARDREKSSKRCSKFAEVEELAAPEASQELLISRAAVLSQRAVETHKQRRFADHYSKSTRAGVLPRQERNDYCSG